jgi:hypothetical protein
MRCILAGFLAGCQWFKKVIMKTIQVKDSAHPQLDAGQKMDDFKASGSLKN